MFWVKNYFINFSVNITLDLLFTYHPLWLLPALIIAFFYAWFLYRKDELLVEVERSLKLVLAAFRFVSVSLILILLIGVILEKFTERKEKPMLFVVNDNSASVLLTADSTYYKEKYVNELQHFSDNLSNSFEVLNYSFSSELQGGFSKEYDGKLTDISTVFNTIFDQYSNRNIGGVVLASDGIYNTGANPVYAVARKSFLPVFTIGLGDTATIKDVRIDQVNHNDIAFLGNEFPVEVSLSETKCPGETVTVSIYDGDKLLKEQQVTFGGDNEQQKVLFTLNAERVGFRKYRAEVSGVDGEYSLKNNSANFYIEIIDGRQKILIATQAPHPDVGALRSVIENNKNYEVDVKRIKDLDNLTSYDLVVVHNYQAGSTLLDDYISTGSGPVLFIVGNTTDIRALSDLKIGFSGRTADTEEVGFSHNTNFKEVLLSPEIKQTLSSAPPLQAPFGNLSFSSAIEVMAYQKVGNIQLEQPLIYFTQKQDSRLGVIMGEGIWRWRLYDQLKNKATNRFNDFFSRIITYLAIKENKDPFKINIENEYNESEAVLVKAELYNQSYDLVNDPEVKFKYTNESGDEFESYFVKTLNAYQLNLGKLNQGVYNWEASTTFQDKNYVKKGTFLVRELKIESLNSVADHRLLRNISDNSGGGFYFPNQLNNLENDIKNRDDLVTVVYQEKEFDDLIDYKWLFILIVLFLSVEWFIRKFQGAY